MEEQTIIKRLSILRELEQDLSILKEQYDDAVNNDPEYQRAQDEMEDLKTQIREKNTTVKEKVLEKTSYKNLREDIKEKKDEIKNHKEILSHELVEYYKDTGVTEIEDDLGDVKKMKFNVKLVN